MRASRISAWIGTVGLGVVATGIVLSPAQAGTCATWTDPAGDASPHATINGTVLAAPVQDDDLDITNVSVGSAAGDLSVMFKIAKLDAAGPANQFGDEFILNFTAGTKAVKFVATRDFSGAGSENTATISIAGTKGPATATFDIKASTVTIVAKAGDVTTLNGGPIDGVKGTAFGALSYGNDFDQVGFPLYDEAPAPATLTTTFGSGCSGAGPAPAPAPASPVATAAPSAAPSASPVSSASPTASATPSSSAAPTSSAAPSSSAAPGASPSASTPAGGDTSSTAPFTGYAVPRKGCFDYTDPANDSTIALFGSVPDPEASSSSDTEIIGVTHRTAPGSIGGLIKTFIKVKALGATGPGEATGDGDSFSWNFTVGGKAVVITAGRTSGKPVAPTATVGGTDQTTKIKPAATFDTKNSTVILSADLVGLGDALGSLVTSGVQLTKVSETSSWLDFADTPSKSDTAAGKGEAENYSVGSADVCFFPLPGEFQPEAIKPTQFGDNIDIGVTFVDSESNPVSDAVISVSLPHQAAMTTTTDADGFATMLMPATINAGKSTLTFTFPGDDTVGKTTTAVPVTIVAEKTILSLASAKSGSSKVVTVTLLDDDKHPVPAQRVGLKIGSRSVVVTTDAKGKAIIKGVKSGTKIVGTYAGVSGQYLGSKKAITA